MTEEKEKIAENIIKIAKARGKSDVLQDQIKRLELEREELKRLLNKSMEQTDEAIAAGKKAFESMKKYGEALKDIKIMVHKESFEKCPLEPTGINDNICYLTLIDEIEKRIDEVIYE